MTKTTEAGQRPLPLPLYFVDTEGGIKPDWPAWAPMLESEDIAYAQGMRWTRTGWEPFHPYNVETHLEKWLENTTGKMSDNRRAAHFIASTALDLRLNACRKMLRACKTVEDKIHLHARIWNATMADLGYVVGNPEAEQDDGER